MTANDNADCGELSYAGVTDGDHGDYNQKREAEAYRDPGQSS